jgi:UDP-N-acetylglucosamine--N-acetylmuramyl-(pentapeptide) pyrophosphoryl-undecaprenol N-acetylglucosamine transferase
VGLAARLLGITSAIQEQNSIPGVANRILGRIVDLVFIGFESAKSFFPEKKTHFTGNPIRREIAEAVGREKPRSDTFTLLVFGGSQGARAVNQAAGRAVVQLAGQGMNFKVIHQTGAADLEEVRALYADLPIQTEVEAFIGDMERVYLQADLAVCRAGALTVAETAVMGLPAIYIPLPFAAHNHQEINARSMSEAGAAEVVPQSEATPEVLAEKIGYYLRSDRVINRMRQAALSRAKPEAAEAICDICEARAAGGRKKKAGG